MAAAVGVRAKERVIREMHETLRASMTEAFVRCDDKAQTYDLARAQAEVLVQLKYPDKNQTSYKAIPIFPNDNGIRSNPPFHELNNLYIQMDNLALEVSSLVISTHKSIRRRFDKLAVTPKSPGSVLIPTGSVTLPIPKPGPVDMELDAAEGTAKPESSKAEKKATKPESSKAAKKKRRNFAPPDAKVPSKRPPEKEKEGEKMVRIKGKDTYHIIRIYQETAGIYLELLRQDSDGYISAFRILYSLEDFETAYWCIFSDFARLSIHLPFINIRLLTYDSGYSFSLSDIYYDEGTLDFIITHFLVDLYMNPFQRSNLKGKIYFEILCLVFGEAPRLEAARKFIETHSEFSHVFCASKGTPWLKLGSLLSNLILKWSSTGDTALYLLLTQFEKYIKEGIEASRSTSNRTISSSASLTQLFEQFEYNQGVAHDRCATATENLERIFLLSRDEDPSGKLFRYNELALYELLNEQLHLLKHEDELVTSVILRQGGFKKKIPLLGFKHEAKNIGNKPVTSQEVLFWNHFNLFYSNLFDELQRWKEPSAPDLIMFLEEARPLIEFGFEQQFLEISNLVDAKCNAFNQIRFNETIKQKVNKKVGGAAAAAEEALTTGVQWERRHTSEMVMFLRTIRDRN